MEALTLLKRINEEALSRAAHLTFDKKHKWHLNLVCLYGSLIEFSSAIVFLIDGSQLVGVPVLFRSFLEAYVDFISLAKDRSYGYYMDATYNDQWLKIYREAKKENNPFLDGLTRANGFDAEAQAVSSELKRLGQQGYRPLKVIERFKKADMVEEYHSIYNFICGHAHNDIRALIERHLEISEHDFKVVLYKDVPLNSFLHYVDPACALLIGASQKMHEVFNTSQKEAFDLLLQQLNEIRGRYDEVKGARKSIEAKAENAK